MYKNDNMKLFKGMNIFVWVKWVFIEQEVEKKISEFDEEFKNENLQGKANNASWKYCARTCNF